MNHHRDKYASIAGFSVSNDGNRGTIMKKLQDTLVYKMLMIKTKIQDTSRVEFQELGITKSCTVCIYISMNFSGISADS